VEERVTIAWCILRKKKLKCWYENIMVKQKCILVRKSALYWK